MSTQERLSDPEGAGCALWILIGLGVFCFMYACDTIKQCYQSKVYIVQDGKTTPQPEASK